MNEKARLLKEKSRYTTDDLRAIMELLRAPDGCPWDREQDHKSIRRNLIEETYEVVEAIDTDNKTLMCEELGDLMLQVIFHARIAEESGDFTLDDVTDGICKKLILRHPHIFSDVVARTSEEVLKNWDAIKVVEKQQKSSKEVLDSVSHSLPSLIRADKICQKAKKLGTDEIKASDVSENEIGQALLSIVAAANNAGIDPEEALAKTLDQYIASQSKA